MGLIMILIGIMMIAILAPVFVAIMSFIGMICFNGIVMAIIDILPIIIGIWVVVYLKKRWRK